MDIQRDGMLLVGFLCGVAQVTGRLPVPIDGLAYWNAGTSSNPYPEHWGSPGIGQWLYYPPPVVQMSRLLQPLGPALFTILLTVTIFAAMWYCARRWSFVLLGVGLATMVGALPSWGAVFLAYALLGNVQWILAALTVAALKRPWLWSLQVVSKMTSAIGWWWHPLRGEWRAAFQGATITVAIVGVSIVISPELWVQYAGFIGSNYDLANPPMEAFAVPLGIRLLVAAGLLAWGARTGRAWVVPVTCGLAVPALWGIGFAPFLVAATRLVSPPNVSVPRLWRRPLGRAMFRAVEPDVLVLETGEAVR